MNSKSPQVSFVFDRRKKATTSVKASVEIRITHNYKQKFISTGVRLYSNQWKNGKIVNCPDIIQISQTLDKLLVNIRQILFLMMQQESVDITLIPEKLKELENKKISFIEFCKQRAAVRMYGKKKDTQERYTRFIKLFTEYGKIQRFEDINEINIIAYDEYLAKTGMKPYSKWNNYHRFLNSFIMDAVDAKQIITNPYNWVNIDRSKSSIGIGKYLTPEEFKRIKETPMPSKSLERVRDLFVFQTYTCLSYSDLKDFDSNNIKEVKGMSVYTGKRLKTGASFTIPILPVALEALNKYKGVLPIISNVRYNEHLKTIARITGIDKPISTHWARHTGATLLLNEGVDMRIVSKICGHSSSKITEQVYAKLLDETVVEAISKLEAGSTI